LQPYVDNSNIHNVIVEYECSIIGGIGGLLGVGIAIQGAGEEDSDNNSDTSSDLPKDNSGNNLYTPGGHFVDLDDPY